MKKISELFDVKYGVNLELNTLTICNKNNKSAINFVSRTSRNNGVSAIVEKIANVEPAPAGTITVAGGGSVLETFLQPTPFYSGRDLFYLTPKEEMSDKIKLFYCACIRKNKYKYNYGRQANKTLKDIMIPNITEIPDYVVDSTLPDYSNILKAKINDDISLLSVNKSIFKIEDVFSIEYPKTLIYSDMIPKDNGINFVSSRATNNGVVARVEKQYDFKIFSSKCITVPLKGSVLSCSIQTDPCYVAHQTAVLTCKEDVSIYVLVYLVTLLNANKFRFNYGRQADKTLKELLIELPVTLNGTPDYKIMENYIKSLPYSSSI